SLPVAIAITPSSASARELSMRVIRACGYGECRIFPTSMPGTLRSSVYLPAPVVFPAASTMATGLPIMEKSVIFQSSTLRRSHSLLLSLDGGFDCLIHLVVSGAAAQVPAQCMTDFPLGRIRVARKQALHRHNESRSTVAALCSSPIAIRFLNCCQAAMLAHTFDRGDLLLLATGGQQRTGEHGHPIHKHCARAAGRIIAAALGAGEFQIFAQHIQKQFARLDG